MKYLILGIIIVGIILVFIWPKQSTVQADDGRISTLYTTTVNDGHNNSVPLSEIKDNHLNVICFIVGDYNNYGGTSLSCLTEKEIKGGMK